MKKFTIGIMSSKWEITAESVDVAICTLRLHTQSTAPIAIYEPEGIASRFTMPSDDAADKMEAFLYKKENQDAIKEAYKTLKKLEL